MGQIVSLQATMFVMIALGVLVRKTGMVGEEGRQNITDLVLNVILPANIVKSFLIPFDMQTLRSFAVVLGISVCIQIGALVLGRLLYAHTEETRRKCLVNGLLCSNAGFLGNPIAEGVYGSLGLAYASIYLIPQRIMMWSSGLAVFSGSTDRREVARKVLRHPCIIACELGLLLLFTQWQLPQVILGPLSSLSACNTALSMLVIGMILAQLHPADLLDRQALAYSFVRLVLVPFLVWIP